MMASSPKQQFTYQQGLRNACLTQQKFVSRYVLHIPAFVDSTHLAEKDSPETLQFSDKLALHSVHLFWIINSLKIADPAHIPHRGIMALHMELILKTHGQAVQWAFDSSRIFLVLIQVRGGVKRKIEHDLMEAIILE